MKDPTRPATTDGIAMEAAPVNIAGVGASASCPLTIIIIITTDTTMHSNLSAAPAILREGISQITNYPQVEYLHLFDLSACFEQLRTLNPYRASLIFSEYLYSGCIPTVKEVNDEEPIFTRVPFLNPQLNSCLFQISSQVLSPETKKAAEEIDAKMQLGSKFNNVIHSKGEADALFDLYQNEKYLLAENAGKFNVMLKSGASPQDMLRAMFQICYLHWLERHLGVKSRNIISDCKPGGKLTRSLECMQREFDTLQQNATTVGWLPDGLVARPLPFRLHVDNILPGQ